MRVLSIHNVDPATPGGYERILLGTDAALRAAGHESEIFVPEGFITPDGFARSTWRRRRNLSRALTGRVPTPDIDVVCYWGMGGLHLGLIDEVRRGGLPAVGVVGDGWMRYGPEVTGTNADLADGVRWLFISEAVRGAAPPGVEGDVVHPGVDPQRFRFSAPREWSGRLAYVGRVAPGKGVEVAVEAMDELPGMTLTIDGPVPDGYEVPDERVRLARTPPDRVADAYAAADVVLFPVTWPEPWGLVPLEAMSVGRPVVATGTGGSGEYLRDSSNCLLVAPGDHAALAAAVRRLADDQRLRDRLIAGGRATAARFTAAAFEARVVEELAGRVRAR